MDESFVSMKHGVEFPHILDQYNNEHDIVLDYRFVDYSARAGDRIAIFKLGWSSVKDYVMFEWVPVEANCYENHQVMFKKENLPKNSTDMYQACYISTENELHGASVPFQIGPNNYSIMISMTGDSKSSLTSSSVLQSTSEKNDEYLQLKEENQLLKNTLTMLTKQNKEMEDLRNFKSVVEKLADVIKKQQEEIDNLKEKLIEGGEKYKKLYLEKVKVEKMLTAPAKAAKQDTKIVNKPVNLDFTIGDFKSIPPFPLT